MLSQYKAISSEKTTRSTSMKKFVEASDAEELCHMILKVINTSGGMRMLDDLLQAFSQTSERCHHDKRMKLIKAVLEELKRAKVNDKHVDDIVNRIVAEFHLFDGSHLVKLVDYCLDGIRCNDDDFMSWKDVLPPLLERLVDDKTIDYRGNDVSGQDYKLTILRSICDWDLNPKIFTSLAKMFVEILADMKDKAISVTIMKALTNGLASTELSQLPPLTHQLMRLGPDHNSTLLFATLSKYFAQNYANISEENQIEEKSAESIVSTNTVTLKELQDVESTVLYHIHQSILDNENGAKEYMKCLRLVVNALEYILDQFVMSVLLQLADLYEDQALPILKSAVLRQIEEEEQRINNAWLRGVAHAELSTFEVISRVIESSKKNRQLVLKGMINFAFVLLGIERKLGAESHLPWDYGCKIVQTIARKHSETGGTILEILVDKIVRSGSSITQYSDCLTYLCRRLTIIVLEHQVWITTLLENILDIAPMAAAQILRAILPLMRVSGSIRDNLITILRKALYRRGVQTRQMAVLGFLQLLKDLKLTTLNALSQSETLSITNVASSSSASLFTQATLEPSSQRASSSNPWYNTNFCREILSILKKCFTHEADVRSHLYRELYYGILRNTELTEYVVELLLEHFDSFHEKDGEVLPPLNFDKCGSVQGIDVVMQEPLGDLVFALQKIYLKVASKNSATIDRLAGLLESLCERMMKTDLGHLGIDDVIDLSGNLPKSQQKILNLKLTISVHEALIAFRIASWSKNSENVGQSVISLFKGYSRFVDFVKRLGKKKARKGKMDTDKDGHIETFKKPGRPATVKMPNTVMDFDTIAKSIVLLYNPSNRWSTKEQTDSLRGRVEFHQYILQTCVQLFRNVKSLKDHELQICLELNKKNFFIIGETLYTRVVTADLKRTVSAFNRSVAALGVECFKECCDVMCNQHSTELPGFLEATCDAERSQSLSRKIQSLITPLKDVFIENLTDEDQPEDASAAVQVIPVHLIDVIANFIKKITFNEVKADKEIEWLNKVAEGYEQMDVQVASKVVQLILLIEDRSLEYGETVHAICDELGTILGRVKKNDINVDDTRRFHIINEYNVYIAYIAVNRLLSMKMQNVVWLLGTLNAEYTAMQSLEADSEANRRKTKDKENSLCRQFAKILNTFEILANVQIEPGAASDATFKNIQRVYNFAGSLTKYFKKKSTKHNPYFQSVEFVPVVRGAGTTLKHAVTNLIHHIEANQKQGKSNDALLRRNKILKETKVIPGVVQAMDMFDKEIVLLAKKTNVDLKQYTKYETIRDFAIDDAQFKINLDKMKDIEQTQSTNSADGTMKDRTLTKTAVDDDKNGTLDESDGSPKAKKRRI